MTAEAPGRLVSIGTHRLHIDCAGSGTPSVVFDAALAASSISWTLVKAAVTRVTHACAYDRTGLAWSDAGPGPRTAGRAVDELRELLRRAEVPAPYVLVGHSYGGLVMRIFAARYPDLTAALVLVDPALPGEWAEPDASRRQQIARGTRLCRQGEMAARLGIARLVAALAGIGALRPARALVGIVSRGGLRQDDESILAPMWKLPAEARRPLRRFWTEPKFFATLGSQIASICESAAEARDADRHGYGNVPLVVLSSARQPADVLAQHERVARLSTRGRHVVVPDTGHWIPLDNPLAVADAVIDVVEEVRSEASRIRRKGQDSGDDLNPGS